MGEYTWFHWVAVGVVLVGALAFFYALARMVLKQARRDDSRSTSQRP